MEYSIVIPLFNEAESLGVLQERIEQVMRPLSCQYEIIYVNDGSNDNSLERLEELKKKYNNIESISLKSNRGQSAALYVGFKKAQGEWIITMDADCQNPPEEISKLIKEKDGVDFITGIRKKRKDTLLRRISSQTAKAFRYIVLKDTTQDAGCSLKMFKREIVSEIPFFKNFHRFFTFLVRLKGFLVREVYVAHNGREFGKSKYTTFRRAREGFFDLGGVYWLKRRILKYEIERG
ncbi:MAG: glycosyltransferase family 2 protein [Candidatus Omnitrophica bacterium]|nr:glycosyltransferase family 2 protein [Candidatus Omnitrophota bacterium]